MIHGRDMSTLVFSSIHFVSALTWLVDWVDSLDSFILPMVILNPKHQTTPKLDDEFLNFSKEVIGLKLDLLVNFVEGWDDCSVVSPIGLFTSTPNLGIQAVDLQAHQRSADDGSCLSDWSSKKGKSKVKTWWDDDIWLLPTWSLTWPLKSSLPKTFSGAMLKFRWVYWCCKDWSRHFGIWQILGALSNMTQSSHERQGFDDLSGQKASQCQPMN